mmetsp:Transcript_30165/g.103764  ORF Transcript_30165/g.103764 Transcript_30165/m.103764 type:complete len:208 (-) Transcript_30165:445-1068(-)
MSKGPCDVVTATLPHLTTGPRHGNLVTCHSDLSQGPCHRDLAKTRFGKLFLGTLPQGSSHRDVVTGSSSRRPCHRVLLTGTLSQGPRRRVLVSGTLSRSSCLRGCCHGDRATVFFSQGQGPRHGALVSGTLPRGPCHRLLVAELVLQGPSRGEGPRRGDPVRGTLSEGLCTGLCQKDRGPFQSFNLVGYSSRLCEGLCHLDFFSEAR